MYTNLIFKISTSERKDSTRRFGLIDMFNNSDEFCLLDEPDAMLIALGKIKTIQTSQHASFSGNRYCRGGYQMSLCSSLSYVLSRFTNIM